MPSLVRVGLVGISGYGENYVRALLDEPLDPDFKLVAVADPNAPCSARVDQLRRQSVAIYSSIEELLGQSDVDLLMMSTPLQMHAKHIRLAKQRGISVLCEKPLTATFDQARELANMDVNASQAAAAAFVAIGFQWSFSAAMEALKSDVIRGDFGAPVRLKSIALYPRPTSYYGRNNWAGKKFTPDGDAVFDSPVNNATSHFLHAMLYVLGPERQYSVMPTRITAEIYRANAIETFDSAALRAWTANGAEILFYTAHCIDREFGPVFRYEFEHAVVDYSEAQGEMVARFADGRTKSYGRPSDAPMRKIWSCIDAVRTGRPIACGIAATVPHTLCASAAYGPDSVAQSIPSECIRYIGSPNDPLVAVDGLADGLIDCYERAVLPSDSGKTQLAWATRGKDVDLQTARWSMGLHYTARTLLYLPIER